MNKRKLIYLMATVTLLTIIPSVVCSAQKVALKTNLAHWALMGTPNAGVEFALSPKWTLDVDGGVNLWKFSEPREMRHWAVQPELRYWFCESFNQTFIGLHGHVGQVNAGGWNIPIGRFAKLKDHRYEGTFYGAGISVGHQFVLSPLMNIELSVGGGWAHIDYRKYDCAICGKLISSDGKYDYFGLTRATLSLLFFLK